MESEMQSGEWEAILDPHNSVEQSKRLYYAPENINETQLTRSLKEGAGGLYFHAGQSRDGVPIAFPANQEPLEEATIQDWQLSGRSFIALAALLEKISGWPAHIKIVQTAQNALKNIILEIQKARAVPGISLTANSLLARRDLRKRYAGPLSFSDSDLLYVYAPERFRPLFITGIIVALRSHFPRTDTARFIEKCHASGYRVDYQNVPSAAAGKILLEMGADGIISPDPQEFAPLFQPFARKKPQEKILKTEPVRTASSPEKPESLKSGEPAPAPQLQEAGSRAELPALRAKKAARKPEVIKAGRKKQHVTGIKALREAKRRKSTQSNRKPVRRKELASLGKV